MNGLFKAAKKKDERSAAEKAMMSDGGKGIATGAIGGGIGGAAGGAIGGGFVGGSGGAAAGGVLGAAGGTLGGAATGSVKGGIDGYIGQKVLGGEFDDSYSGSLKRNVVGAGLRGTGAGVGKAIISGNPAHLGEGIGAAIGGAGRGTIGKFIKDKVVE